MEILTFDFSPWFSSVCSAVKKEDPQPFYKTTPTKIQHHVIQNVKKRRDPLDLNHHLTRSNFENSLNKSVKVFSAGIHVGRDAYPTDVFPFDGRSVNLMF